MVILLATIAGLTLWIVLWALNIKAFDAFMLTMLIVLGAVAYHAFAKYLPGNRKEENPPPGA
jgi:hypothetical protein